MIPQQLKQMFGLNNKKDLGMANNIWKMLDEMAQNNPDNYKEFIQKNLKEGVQQVKQKQQEKQKPFRIKPEKGFLLEFDVILNEKYLSISQENQATKIGNKLHQKLDLSSQKWQDIKKKFRPKFHICLNICHSDRVKLSVDKNKKQLHNLTLDRIKQIQVFYYSVQGPKQVKKQKSDIVQLDYCMILNKNMYQSLMRQGANGKKMLMSLSISYFEQRLQTDLNPLLKLYNPEVYRKLAFYAVEKLSIQVNMNRNYFFGNSSQVEQFLLQREIDTKRQKQLKQEEENMKRKINDEQKKVEIKFREENLKSQKTGESQKQSIISQAEKQKKTIKTIDSEKLNHSIGIQKNQYNLNEITLNSENQNKKLKGPLIQVLNQTEVNQKTDVDLPYELKQTQQGYHIEILTPGIASIDELDLEISDLKVKLKILKTSQNVEIIFNSPINSDSIKAKLKKKTNRLIIEAPFLNRK